MGISESGIYELQFNIISKELKMKLRYEESKYTWVKITRIEGGLYISDMDDRRKRRENDEQERKRYDEGLVDRYFYADMGDFCIKTPIYIYFDEKLITKTHLGFSIDFFGLFNFNAKQVYLDDVLVYEKDFLDMREIKINESNVDVLEEYLYLKLISIIAFPVEGKLEILIQDSNQKEKKIVFNSVLSYFYTTNIKIQQKNELSIGKIMNIQNVVFKVDKRNEGYIKQFSSKPNYCLLSNDIVIYIEADAYRVT